MSEATQEGTEPVSRKLKTSLLSVYSHPREASCRVRIRGQFLGFSGGAHFWNVAASSPQYTAFRVKTSKSDHRASLVPQRFLIWDHPTRHGAVKPVNHSC